MTFVKGQGRIAGRQKGTPNKSTSNLKSTIQGILDRKFETIESDLEELEGKDKIAFILKLLDFVLPRQKEQKINFSDLSDEEIDILIDRLKNNE